jgi:hypothetical protein
VVNTRFPAKTLQKNIAGSRKHEALHPGDGPGPLLPQQGAPRQYHQREQLQLGHSGPQVCSSVFNGAFQAALYLLCDIPGYSFFNEIFQAFLIFNETLQTALIFSEAFQLFFNLE